jgi:membrane protein
MWKTAWSLIKETVKDWSDDNATRLAAALAYYSILSLAPLLVVAVSVAGLVFGDEAARGQIAEEISRFVGPQAGEGIQLVLQHARGPEAGIVGSTVGLAVLLFGASGVFTELQSALNTIWQVEPKPGRGVWGIIRDRFFSFTMVLGVAFLLLVSLALTAALSAVGAFFSSRLPGGETLWQIINFGVSLGVITLLFALIFKVIPDVKIGWQDVWPGALFTALLFTLGKFGLGLYLGRESVTSPYGAAGSIIVFVIWVYYAAQIMFLGAEFTQVYALHRGKRLPPTKNAIPKPDPAHEPAVTEDAAAKVRASEQSSKLAALREH